MLNVQTQGKNIESIANQFIQQGYEVIVEPSKEQLPFDLGHYQPDLIARKGDKGVILEFKPHLRFSIDRLQEIAERIATHTGWQFSLVTLNDVTEEVITTDIPTWQQLQSRLAQVEILIKQAFFEPALLYLWGVIEAMFRKRAITQKLPIDRLPLPALIDHMYSSGEISLHEFDALKIALKKCNKIAHGFNICLTEDDLKPIFETTHHLLNSWQSA